ncbi:hypothetical protein H5393_12385 [Tessaracoccus sp. MC1756]|nr:hypothetical protein [Tessaracoccus sp. MC1756]
MAPDKIVKVGMGRVDVVVMAGDNITHSFARQLASEEASVFRGACRVYPPGALWEADPRSVPLHLARTPQEIAALPERLLANVTRELQKLEQRPDPAGVAATANTANSRGLTAPRTSMGAARGPNRLAVEVTTVGQAEALGSYLRDPNREVPVVVVTRAAGIPFSYADVSTLRDDLSGLAEVFEIATPTASWAFTATVPDKCQVYGGAGRVYPLGTEWENDPYLSPLRFAYGRGDRDDITRHLVADAMRVVSTTGSIAVDPGITAPVTVEGTVEGVVADRAVVRTDDGGFAVAWPELVVPGEPAERIFAKGMRLDGQIDPDSRRLDVRTPRLSRVDALRSYHPDATVLVRVAAVASSSCRVELFPGVNADINNADVADAQVDLLELMTVGEVLPALIVERGPGVEEWLLSIREAGEPQAAVPAPSLLPGGPAWLVPRNEQPLVDTPLERAAGDEEDSEASTDGSATEQALRRENRQHISRVRELENRTAQLESQRDLARKQLREALRRRARDGSTHTDDSALFEDEADQMTFEINLAWARTTLPAEKNDRPLRRWTYSPHFFDTLRSAAGISREKVIEVIVHVLTGRDTDLKSRELHQLRSGKGGDDAPITRDNGEICWRVSLQSKTPSARRLHYWSCADGSVELGSVRLHDDFRP